MSENASVKLCKRGHPRTPENRCADGRCKPCRREREREYEQRPERRKRRREYDQRPEQLKRRRDDIRKRRQDPEYRERERECCCKYNRFVRPLISMARANKRDRKVLDELIRRNPWVLDVPELKEQLYGT